jgi:hypothetical protein
MSDPRRIEVGRCITCPLVRMTVSNENWICDFSTPPRPVSTRAEAPPEFCPLRKRDVLVVLKEAGGG